jgi:hypothetical protein
MTSIDNPSGLTSASELRNAAARLASTQLLWPPDLVLLPFSQSELGQSQICVSLARGKTLALAHRRVASTI